MQFFRLSFLISCFTILSFIEFVSGSSYYQIKGLGSLTYFVQADAMGRGGTAIAIADRNTINSINPAGLIFVNITRISGDFYHENINLKTANVTGLSHYSNLHGVKLLVPIAVNKFAISMGIKPFTKNDFIVESSGELSTGNKYLKQIINKGGLNQFTLGIATSLKRRIFTGLFFNYNFGRVEENWKVDFISDLFIDTSDRDISSLWGGSVTAGLMTMIRSNLLVGATYSHSIDLSGNNHIAYVFGKSSKTNSLKMKIPYSWGIGTSYMPNRKIRLSLDYFSQPWSKLEINNNKLKNYKDSYRVSSGIELLPSEKLISGYFKKVTYRAGFHFGKFGYQGNDVAEYMGTLGFGFPFYERFGRIDIAFGYGRRGSVDKNPVEESVFQLMISVSGGEKWFIRPK